MSDDELTALQKLEQRIAKLESDRWEKWVQSAIIPIVLLLLGAWVNSTLQARNDELEKTRLTSQQIDVAQKMLPGMFDGNPSKAFATARLLRKVVDTPVSREVDSVLTAYYAERVRASVADNQLDTAAAILNAVQAIGGTRSSEQLSAAVGRAGTRTIQLYRTKTDSARALEKDGFEALGAANIPAAHAAFQQAESIYPGYRIAFEMERLLRAAVRDPSQTNAVLKTSVDRYARYMPPGVISALRKRIDESG